MILEFFCFLVPVAVVDYLLLPFYGYIGDIVRFLSIFFCFALIGVYLPIFCFDLVIMPVNLLFSGLFSLFCSSIASLVNPNSLVLTITAGSVGSFYTSVGSTRAATLEPSSDVSLFTSLYLDTILFMN